MTNDGVVPLSSAQGRSTVFRIPVGKSSPRIADEDPGPVEDEQGLECP